LRTACSLRVPARLPPASSVRSSSASCVMTRIHLLPEVSAVGAALALGAVADARARATASAREAGSTIVTLLEGGPLAARRVAGRWWKVARRKTIEVDADDGGTCRYCLAEWAEVGRSAVHTFLCVV
jgi:hypothetical protein